MFLAETTDTSSEHFLPNGSLLSPHVLTPHQNLNAHFEFSRRGVSSELIAIRSAREWVVAYGLHSLQRIGKRGARRHEPEPQKRGVQCVTKTIC